MKLLTCLVAAGFALFAVINHMVGPQWAGVAAPSPMVGFAIWTAAAFVAATLWVFLVSRDGPHSLTATAIIGALFLAVAFVFGARNWWALGHDIAAAFVIAAIAVFVVTALTRVFGNQRPAHGH